MKISIWSKISLLAVALVLTGAGCTISLGTGSRQDGGVFRSDDHGRTWIQKNFINVANKQNYYIDDVTGRALVFDPQKADHLYLGTLKNGIWETTNAGEQWHSTSLKSGGFDCISLDVSNPQVMYTAAGQTVLKSINGGQAWTTVYTESQPDQTVNCVLVNPVVDREIWATTSGGKILFSEDYGQHWSLVHTLAPMQPRRLYIPTATPTQLFIFTRGNGIFRADQSGKVWTDLTPQLPDQTGAKDIRAVEIQANNFYLATTSGLYKSTDQANTWVSIPTLVTGGTVPLQNVAVNPQNNQDIFITGNQKLYHTVDAGATWSVITLPTKRTPVLLTFDPNNTDRLYFAGFKAK